MTLSHYFNLVPLVGVQYKPCEAGALRGLVFRENSHKAILLLRRLCKSHSFAVAYHSNNMASAVISLGAGNTIKGKCKMVSTGRKEAMTVAGHHKLKTIK